jgi:hypothetical protein
MKKISPIAILIAVLATLSVTVIAFFVPYQTENQGILIDFVCALIWFGGMLTAYADQVMYSEQKRRKRWEE